MPPLPSVITCAGVNETFLFRGNLWRSTSLRIGSVTVVGILELLRVDRGGLAAEARDSIHQRNFDFFLVSRLKSGLDKRRAEAAHHLNE